MGVHTSCNFSRKRKEKNMVFPVAMMITNTTVGGKKKKKNQNFIRLKTGCPVSLPLEKLIHSENYTSGRKLYHAEFKAVCVCMNALWVSIFTSIYLYKTISAILNWRWPCTPADTVCVCVCVCMWYVPHVCLHIYIQEGGTPLLRAQLRWTSQETPLESVIFKLWLSRSLMYSLCESQ